MTTLCEITVLSDRPVVIEGSWVDGAPYLHTKDIEGILGWELKRRTVQGKYMHTSGR